MANVSGLLQRYIDEHIRLDRGDIAAAAKSREWLLDSIKARIDKADGPKLYGPDPFLRFGSYFKGTKVADVDEYDILVVVDSYSGEFSEKGQILGHGQGTMSPNPKYNGNFYKEDQTGVSPNKMLSWLRGIVNDVVKPYGGIAPERDGQAITAYIQSKDLKIDLVPAGIFMHPASGNIFYNIATSNRSNNWVTTLPHLDLALIDDVAKGKDNFKNVIRICKRIKDQYKMEFSSFAIELMAIQYALNTGWSDDLSSDLYGVIQHIVATLGSGVLIDSFSLTQSNILAGIDNLDDSAITFGHIAQEIKVLTSELASETISFSLIRDYFENTLSSFTTTAPDR